LNPTLRPLEAGDLTIEIAEAGAQGFVCLYWKGRSGARNPSEVLTPYFKEIIARAAERRVGVEMHFETLEHFNSSTVAALIHLIQHARGNSVPLVFVYDQNLKWQKLSFEAMRVFVKSDGLLQMRSS
jgi:hypothetical protein